MEVKQEAAVVWTKTRNATEAIIKLQLSLLLLDGCHLTLI